MKSVVSTLSEISRTLYFKHTLREASGAIFGAGVGVPVTLVLCRLTAVGGSPVGFLEPADIDCRLAGALGPVPAICLLSRGGC